MASDHTYQIDPSRLVVKKGPAVGQHLGQDIPAWIQTADGGRHEFRRVLADNGFRKLTRAESVIAPGLVFNTTH